MMTTTPVLTDAERVQARNEALARGRAKAAKHRQKARLAKLMAAEGTEQHAEAFDDLQARQAALAGSPTLDPRLRAAPVETGDGLRVSAVQHRGPKSLTLYDEQGRASQVSTNNLLAVTRQAEGRPLYLECPLCGVEHDDPDSPNACGAQQPVKFADCPVCRVRQPDGSTRPKRLYDDRDIADLLAAPPSDDPNRVQVYTEVQTTPAQRIKAKFDLHMAVYHPRRAREMGIRVPADEIGR